MVFDIQDVGVRYYTYVWTMALAWCAAGAGGASFIVLDRSNPVGTACRGDRCDEESLPLVGLKPIVQQHGMTVGELARYFNGELLPGEGDGGKVELEVGQVRGWSRTAPAQETGLPWLPPSPNMPIPGHGPVYSGHRDLRGHEPSEGRGTTRPFELVGAPYLDYR